MAMILKELTLPVKRAPRDATIFCGVRSGGKKRRADARAQLVQGSRVVDDDVSEEEGLRQLLGRGIGGVLEALLARELLERRAVPRPGPQTRALEPDTDRRVDAD